MEGWAFVIGLLLMAVRQFCDYLYQADQHGWITESISWTFDDKGMSHERAKKKSFWSWWLPIALNEDLQMTRWRWKLPRGKKWAWYLDWIPHDAWHIVQSLRNTTMWIGLTLTTYALYGLLLSAIPTLTDSWLIVSIVAGQGALYAISRLLLFSVPMWIINATEVNDDA